MKAGSLLAALIVAVAVTLVLSGRFNPPDDATVRERLEARGISEADLEAEVVVRGSLQINGSEDANVGIGAPIWIEATLYNASDELTVRVPGGSAPVLVGPADAPTVALRPIATAAAELAPRERLHLVWSVEGQPAAGVYRVSLEPTPLLRSRDPVTARVMGARLTVRDEPEDAEVSARYARRLAQLRRLKDQR